METFKITCLLKKGLKRTLFLCSILLFSFSVGCAGSPPLVEQAKAVEAQRHAKVNYASKYASKSYRKGSVYLKKAHEFYEKRVYEKAKRAYDLARRYFEKSETKARITQVKKGGEF